MKKYNHITKEDRNTIEHLIKHNNSCRDIGMATLLWTFIIKSFDSIALVTDNSKMSVISYY